MRKDYAKLYLGSAWYKQRKLHMIWRAIARRHLSCHVAKMLEVWQAEDAWMRQAQAKAEHIDSDGDGETDP
jgi:hypothetical protein